MAAPAAGRRSSSQGYFARRCTAQWKQAEKAALTTPITRPVTQAKSIHLRKIMGWLNQTCGPPVGLKENFTADTHLSLSRHSSGGTDGRKTALAGRSATAFSPSWKLLYHIRQVFSASLWIFFCRVV
jgi:hypothetical protein